uniref:DUF4283 domain-containing protein n=1 Tax=Tanacetum cinerariifolium TaxID=118510 RepID=A0A699L0M2_TANCI|nr:hypothetical protein [Tanacetum cinerariifolium]
MDQANKECLDEDVNQGCMFDSMMDSQKNDSRNLVKSVGREDELKNTSLDIGEDVDVNIGNVESVKFGSANDDMLKRNGGSHNVKLPTVSQDKPDTTDNPKMSYASAVNKLDSVIVNKLMIIPADVDNLGNEFVIFDEELTNDGSRRWHLTLCGFFMGFKMRISELRYNVRRMWSRYGLKEIIENDCVQKWDINVEIDRTEPDKLSLWVRFCNPPLKTLTVKGIGALSSIIGKPLIMDARTATMCTQMWEGLAKKVIGQKTIKMCPKSTVVGNDEQINVASKVQREAQPHEEFIEPMDKENYNNNTIKENNSDVVKENNVVHKENVNDETPNKGKERKEKHVGSVAKEVNTSGNKFSVLEVIYDEKELYEIEGIKKSANRKKKTSLNGKEDWKHEVQKDSDDISVKPT